MKNSKQLLKIARYIVLILLWITVFIAIYQAVGAYKYFQEHPQVIFETNSYNSNTNVTMITNSYNNNTLIEQQDLQNKIQMTDQLIFTIRIGLALLLLYFIIDYFYDPEKHFVTYIKNKLKHINLEDDEIEK